MLLKIHYEVLLIILIINNLFPKYLPVPENIFAKLKLSC